MNTHSIAPDLAKRAPRSPRLRLGGYVFLPRILDKIRALNAGTPGEYRYGEKRMDRHFFAFTGIEPDAFQTAAKLADGDGEMLAWIEANARNRRQPWEIAAWSAWLEARAPDSDAETLADFAEAVGKFTTTREDVKTWFDLLDLDDHVTFGGKA